MPHQEIEHPSKVTGYVYSLSLPNIDSCVLDTFVLFDPVEEKQTDRNYPWSLIRAPSKEH